MSRHWLSRSAETLQNAGNRFLHDESLQRVIDVCVAAIDKAFKDLEPHLKIINGGKTGKVSLLAIALPCLFSASTATCSLASHCLCCTQSCLSTCHASSPPSASCSFALLTVSLALHLPLLLQVSLKRNFDEDEAEKSAYTQAQLKAAAMRSKTRSAPSGPSCRSPVLVVASTVHRWLTKLPVHGLSTAMAISTHA